MSAVTIVPAALRIHGAGADLDTGLHVGQSHE